jgi:hypothetical protein
MQLCAAKRSAATLSGRGAVLRAAGWPDCARMRGARGRVAGVSEGGSELELGSGYRRWRGTMTVAAQFANFVLFC